MDLLQVYLLVTRERKHRKKKKKGEESGGMEKISKICLLNMNLRSEVSYEAIYSNFEKFQNDAAKLTCFAVFQL